MLAVSFGDDGKVAKCEIKDYSTSRGLAEYTRAFVLKYWRAPAFAGKTMPVPINYVLPPHPPGTS
jgi:hypothetical protein